MVALDSFYPMTGVTEQLAQWQQFAPYYYGDGVITTAGNQFAIAQHAPPGMSVDVQTGSCFIQGVFGTSGSVKTLTIAAANATNPRIDRVVLRCDTVAQDLEVLVITGTAAVSPSAPALVRSATQTDYSLYQVLVGTTVTSIVSANLTDERIYASPRGIPLNQQTIVSAATIQPSGVLPLTEGWLAVQISGTTTIDNIATGNLPPRHGAVLVLFFISAGCQVSSAGNVQLPRPYTSGTTMAHLVLDYNTAVSKWTEVARSGEQAPAHQYYGNPTGTAAAATFAAIVAADLPTYGSFAMGTVTQGGTSCTFTTQVARFTQFGKTAIAYANLLLTSAGTAGSAIIANLPAGLTMAAAQQAVGSFVYNHAGTIYVGTAVFGTATSLQFITTSQTNFLGATPSFAVANGDSLSFMITPELA